MINREFIKKKILTKENPKRNLASFIRKDVLKLSLPIMIEQTFVMLLGVCNTMMAGNIGEAAVSAIGMVDSINNMFISFFAALSVGATVVVAQQIGQGKSEHANFTAKQALISGLIISLIISLLLWIFKIHIVNLLYGSAEDAVIKNAKIYFDFTLLTYPFIAINQIINGILRGCGDTKTPMKITIFMNIINIFLGYILIIGIDFLNIPSFGIIGAAIAISISRLIGAGIILFVLFSGSKVIKIKTLFPFKFEWKIQKNIFSIGIPAGIENVLFNLGKLIVQTIVVTMGTASIAANAVAASFVNMSYVPGIGLSLAATTLVGQYIGKKDIIGARNTLVYMTKFGTLCLISLGIIIIPFTESIVRFYTNLPEVIKISKVLIISNNIALIVYAMSFILSAGLKGAGDTRYTMTTSFIGMWIFRIFTGYILGNICKLGVLGVWIGMYTDWFVRGIMYMFRLKGEKWLNHIIAYE